MKKFMNVQVIEIGLPGRAGEEKWRFYGTNTVVKVLETVVYLAFVDGERSLMSRWSLDTSTSEYMIEFYFSTTLKTVSDSLLVHILQLLHGAKDQSELLKIQIDIRNPDPNIKSMDPDQDTLNFLDIRIHPRSASKDNPIIPSQVEMIYLLEVATSWGFESGHVL
ncbi:hypothetical protein YC2023_119338 [Brassica napus]